MPWKVKGEFNLLLASFKKSKWGLGVKGRLTLVGNKDSFPYRLWSLDRHKTVKLTMLILEAKAIGNRVYGLRNQISARYHHKADVFWILWTKTWIQLSYILLFKVLSVSSWKALEYVCYFTFTFQTNPYSPLIIFISLPWIF